MTETNNPFAGRVDRLEGSVSRLEQSVAGQNVELQGLKTGQDGIVRAIGGLTDKLDRSRPGVSSILPWLAAAMTLLTVLGGALAAPQLTRMERIETTVEQRGEVITQLRIDAATAKLQMQHLQDDKARAK